MGDLDKAMSNLIAVDAMIDPFSDEPMTVTYRAGDRVSETYFSDFMDCDADFLINKIKRELQ